MTSTTTTGRHCPCRFRFFPFHNERGPIAQAVGFLLLLLLLLFAARGGVLDTFKDRGKLAGDWPETGP